MLWPQLKDLAPTGEIFIDDEIVPATVLIYDGYSAISTHLERNSRNMIIREVECTDYNNGERAVNVIYDVYNDQHENFAHHCLNSFGARMVRDYLEKGVQQDEIRFNYTGIRQ